MGHELSRRLNIVLPYLYPDYSDDDYHLENASDGKGTYVVWHRSDAAPTDAELAAAKEPAVDAFWWKMFRARRDKALVESDAFGLSDHPKRDQHISYRQELRDLPTTVTKPSYDTLISQDNIYDGIDEFLPELP